MKILLMYPYVSSVILSGEPPLGILYLASILRKKHDIMVIDAHCDKYRSNDIKKFIHRFQPDIVGISCNTLQVPETCLIANTVKKNFPEIKVVVGGAHPSIDAKEMLSNCNSIDIAVIGEGERTMDELINALENGLPLSNIGSIVFRVDDEIVDTPKRDFIKNLDEIPFPAHDLNEPPIRYELFPMLPVLPSRGCPFNCLFCSNPVWGRSNRIRSAKNVADEVEWLVKKYDIKGVAFHDDVFNVDRQFVIDLCRELIKKNLHKKITWSCEAIAKKQLISEEILIKMKEAGCTLISFGMESGNQEIMDNIRKKITLEEVERAVKLCKKVDIQVRGFFMFGNLGEDISTSFDTIRFAKELNLDTYQFTVATPFPGSDYYDIAKRKGWLIDEDYRNYDQIKSHLRTEKLSEDDLFILRDLAYFITSSKSLGGISSLVLNNNGLSSIEILFLLFKKGLKIKNKLKHLDFFIRYKLYVLKNR